MCVLCVLHLSALCVPGQGRYVVRLWVPKLRFLGGGMRRWSRDGKDYPNNIYIRELTRNLIDNTKKCTRIKYRILHKIH